MLLLFSVVGSATAIRLDPGLSFVARWAATAGVLLGTACVLVLRPPGPDRRHRLGVMLLIGLLVVSAYSVGKLELGPQRVQLDPDRIQPRSLGADVSGEPVTSHLYLADVYAPPDRTAGGSRLRLLEDGEALGPRGTPTSDIAQWGLGSYRHTQGRLAFSSSDNSDPRTNGRTYEFLRYPAVPGPVLVILLLGFGFAFVRWLRSEGGHHRFAATAGLIAAASIVALNAFHIDEAPLNIKDARQNLEMAQAIATTSEAREVGWLLSQRREPLPNIVLAAQMRLDPRLEGITRGESVQAEEFQVALKQNTLLYVALLYVFALLSIRRILPSQRQALAAFTVFVGLAHFLFLQFHEYINRNYTEVHAAALLVMSGYFLLRYADTRRARNALLAVGTLFALSLTKGLFIIVLALSVVAVVGSSLRRQIRARRELRRQLVAAVAVTAVLAVSTLGGLALWGARLAQTPADPALSSSPTGFAMSTALPGRVGIPMRRSFWNVRDAETLQQRLARNTPSLVRPDRFRYDRGYEVGSSRLPSPPIWEEPRFSSRRAAQVAAVAVVIYNHVRDPVATAATALSLASLLSVAPRTVDLSYDQRDTLRLLVIAMFIGTVLHLLWRRGPTLWFYLPTLLGMMSYALLAHGRYRYWAPFVPTTFIATSIGLVVLGLAAERWVRRLPQLKRPGDPWQSRAERVVGPTG